ncbi:hypothetical protein H7F30_03395 [Dermacoccus sp. PAMC28757]|uniref:hypothetical protein n=1 Tax=Dermacoccus sp. PAMC28757 TaxID=2762331 RepID=UPI00164D2F53|nr:hypothetical protein [Dermacoccus sp. PAMC28757]QNK53379.1 hypothetical protein H7F30_03395 [Dermacoccus sp. PAMC28757]
MTRKTRVTTAAEGPPHLAVWEQWDGEEPLRAFASRVAASNDLTIAQLVGATYTPHQWRIGHPPILRGLGRHGLLDPVSAGTTMPYRFPRGIQKAWLSGFIDPRQVGHAMVIDLLRPHDEQHLLIDSLIRAQRVGPRMALIEEVAAAFIPRATLDWPPLASFKHPLQSRALDDPSRMRPMQSWTPTVRAYALAALWEHTHMEEVTRVIPVSRNRRKIGYLRYFPRIARDLRTAARWLTAASDLREINPALSTSLEQAGLACLDHHPPPIEEPIARQIEEEGLLSLHVLRTHSPQVVELASAASIATRSLRTSAGHLTASMTRPALMNALSELGPHPLKAPWEPRPFEPPEPPPHVTEAARLLAIPAGLAVLEALTEAADEPPLRVEDLQPWWAEMRAAPRCATQSIAPSTAASSALTRELIWVDLAGTLPSPPLTEALAKAARHTLPEAAMDFREWAETLIDHAWIDDPRVGSATSRRAATSDQCDAP